MNCKETNKWLIIPKYTKNL